MNEEFFPESRPILINSENDSEGQEVITQCALTGARPAK